MFLYRGGYFVLCKIDNILCCNVNLSFALLSGLHFVLFGIAFTHLFNFTCHNRNISFHMLNNHPCLQHRCEKKNGICADLIKLVFPSHVIWFAGQTLFAGGNLNSTISCTRGCMVHGGGKCWCKTLCGWIQDTRTSGHDMRCWP